MSLLPHLTFVWTAASPASTSTNFSLPRTPDRSGRAQRKQPELMIRRTKRHIFSCVKPVAKRLICANSIKFFTTRFLVTSLCGPIANPALPSHQRQPANSLPSHQRPSHASPVSTGGAVRMDAEGGVERILECLTQKAPAWLPGLFHSQVSRLLRVWPW